MSRKEIEEAILELNGFLEKAVSTKVKTILQNGIMSMQNELKAIPQPLPVKPEPIEVVAPEAKRICYSAIPSFSWDQDSSYVTVWLMEGVDGVELLPKENVICEFNENNVDLKINDLNGRYVRWCHPLFGKITPSESKLIVRKNRITLKLRKEHSEQWTSFEPEKSKFKPKEDTTDPNASLMNLMKEMYNSGDENMRRTIGEAMLKAQSGQTPDMTPPM